MSYLSQKVLFEIFTRYIIIRNRKRVMEKPLSLIIFLLMVKIEGQYIGEINYTFSTKLTSAVFSPDGKKLYIGEGVGNIVSVYEDNGSTFAFYENILVGSFVSHVGISPSGDLLIVSTPQGFSMMETTNYTVVQSEPLYGILPLFTQDSQTLFYPSSTTLYIFRKNITYQQVQTIGNFVNISQISVSVDGTLLALGFYMSSSVKIYQLQEQLYVLKQSIMSNKPGFLKISSQQLIVVEKNILVGYKKVSGIYQKTHMIERQSDILHASMNNETFVGGHLDEIFFLQRQADFFAPSASFSITSGPLAITMHYLGTYSMILFFNMSGTLFYKCPQQCIDCSFPTNCLNCIEGKVLIDGKCVTEPTENMSKATKCVKNIMLNDGICKQYCSRECKTCNKTRHDCYECSRGYHRNSEGKCVVEDKVIEMAGRIRCFFNFIRVRGWKFLFFAVDDLWLYNFHKQKYDGITLTVLETIKLIEQRQWELIGLDDFKSELEHSIKESQEYNAHSNKKFMEQERLNNVFLNNTIKYFVFSIPLTIVFVFLCNRLFYCLFNYRISSILRPFSFWGILFELIVQNNVEYLSFLGWRALTIPFSFSFVCKGLLVFTLVMFFIVLISVFCSYLFYYSWYGKFARYFLVNLYRFPSSYLLMTILYGFRPFLKGTAHALFYNNLLLQLWFLLGIEIVMIIITVSFEYFWGNHKSRKVLTLELLYMTGLVCFNFLLLLKYHYIPQQAEICEDFLKIVIWSMLVVLVLRLLLEVVIQNINYKQLRECICPKRASAVTPAKQNLENHETEEKAKENKQKKEEKEEAIQLEVLNLYIEKFQNTKKSPNKMKKKKSKKIKTKKQINQKILHILQNDFKK